LSSRGSRDHYCAARSGEDRARYRAASAVEVTALLTSDLLISSAETFHWSNPNDPKCREAPNGSSPPKLGGDGCAHQKNVAKPHYWDADALVHFWNDRDGADETLPSRRSDCWTV